MGANDYSVLLKARLDTSEIAGDVAKIQGEVNKAMANVGVRQRTSSPVDRIKKEFQSADFKISPTFDEAKINKAMLDIQAKAGKLQKITIQSGFDESGIQKAKSVTIEWTDAAGKTAKEYVEINSEIKATITSVQNLQKEQRLAAREQEKNTKVILDYNKSLQKDSATLASLQEKASKFTTAYSGANLTDIGKKKMEFAKEMLSSFDKGDLGAMKEAEHQFDMLGGSVVDTTGKVKTFGGEMMMIARRTLESAATLGVMYGAINQLKMGIQYVKDLDKELTNVQIATGLTKDEVYELGGEYNRMALELGSTTLEVSKSATLFLKQGKTVEETSSLIKSSMMLSKLGMIENAQASEYLTTIMNGYKLETEDATDIVSKMIAVDNASAASISGMSEALSKTSSVAKDSGVELENLIAYIATVQTVTGQTGEVVGQAFDKIEASWYNR